MYEGLGQEISQSLQDHIRALRVQAASLTGFDAALLEAQARAHERQIGFNPNDPELIWDMGVDYTPVIFSYHPTYNIPYFGRPFDVGQALLLGIITLQEAGMTGQLTPDVPQYALDNAAIKTGMLERSGRPTITEEVALGVTRTTFTDVVPQAPVTEIVPPMPIMEIIPGEDVITPLPGDIVPSVYGEAVGPRSVDDRLVRDTSKQPAITVPDVATGSPEYYEAVVKAGGVPGLKYYNAAGELFRLGIDSISYWFEADKDQWFEGRMDGTIRPVEMPPFGAVAGYATGDLLKYALYGIGGFLLLKGIMK